MKLRTPRDLAVYERQRDKEEAPEYWDYCWNCGGKMVDRICPHCWKSEGEEFGPLEIEERHPGQEGSR
jgi:hypothetical protein